MRRAAAVVALALAGTLVSGTPAEARTCPPASVGGPTVAHITVGTRVVPVKRITFGRGGVLNPPATNRAAGISDRNQPLKAKKGATVITWHVRYGPGCDGALNRLITRPLGSAFTVGAVGVTPRWYKIVSRETVPKGTLKRWWFRHDGRKRLVLITCADYAGGVFRRTMAITAVPIPAPTPAPTSVPDPMASPIPTAPAPAL